MAMTLEAKVAAEGWWAGEHKIKLDGKSDNGVWAVEVDGATNKRCRFVFVWGGTGWGGGGTGRGR